MTVNISKPALNVREKLAELDKPTGIAGEAMLRAETPQEQFNLIGAGRRNLIINGDCNISQRGDFTTASSASDETYYLDRFEQNIGTVSVNKQHITTNQPSALSNTKSWKLIATSTTSSGFMGTRQTIEDYKIFDGREFTVSAWIKTNHPSVRFYLWNGSTTTQGAKTAVSDGEWHRLEETFTFDAASQSRFSVEVIALSAAGGFTQITSGDYVEFTGLQLELGKVATPFEHRSYGEELALCQRYFQKHNWSNAKTLGQFHEPAQFIGPFYYPTTMRATPSFTGNSFGVGSSYVYSAGAYRGAPATFDHDSIKEGFCMLRLANGTLSGTTGVAGSMYGLVFSLDAEL